MWLDLFWVRLILGGIGAAVLLLSVWASLPRKNMPGWAVMGWFILWWLGLPLASFALFPSIAVADAATWGISLAIALGLGYAAGVFSYTTGNKDLAYFAFTQRDLSRHGHKGRRFLTSLWLFCGVLAAAAWLPGPKTYGLHTKLDILALFLIGTPVAFTALPLYPLLALEGLRQSRPGFLRRLKAPEHLLPLRFQSFAYPLPGFFDLLRNHAEQHGMGPTVRLLQRLQIESLQEGAAAKAALRLADTPEWALPFCGEVAVFSNSATVAPLALAGEAGRAVAVLAAKAEKEEEQPLRLFFGDFPPAPSRVTASFPAVFRGRAGLASRDPQRLELFRTKRVAPLADRVSEALACLDKCEGYAQAERFRHLLTILGACAWADSVQTLESLDLPEADKPAVPDWLSGGWSLLQPLRDLVAALPEYRRYADAQTRRAFLEGMADRLEREAWEELPEDWGNLAFDGGHSRVWEELPEYWGNLAVDLARHWIGLLRAEARQAREWLRIVVELPPQHLRVGQQSLALRVKNVSGATARGLRLHVLHADAGLNCAATELQFPAPLERFQETSIHLPFSCTQSGRYLLRAEVIAEDLDGHIARDVLAERLDIGQAGRPYRKQAAAPYVAGEGLGDDRTFVRAR